MTDFPTCDYCLHKWHGLPCTRLNAQTPGRAGEPCECKTAVPSLAKERP